MRGRKKTHVRLLWAVLMTCVGWRFSILSTLCAQQADDVARHSSSSRRFVVKAGDLQVVLERTRQGSRVLNLADAGTDRELLACDPLPLFTATVRHAETKELLTIAAPDSNGCVSQVALTVLSRPGDD